MTEKENEVWAQLRLIIDPDQQEDIVELGYVSHLKVTGNKVFYHLHLPDVNAKVKEQYQFFSEESVRELPWVEKVTTIIAASPKQSSLAPSYNGLKDVSHVVAVASCKGGVGKSTVAVNLAFSLALSGYRVGIFDADVYGPSLPTMVHIEDRQVKFEGALILPFEHAGVLLMSFGFAKDPAQEDDAAIMRGPIVSQVINQLLTGTKWGELDYLIIDMPPGTGDVQLTLTQMVPIVASVLVTTPQQLSYVDVVKGIQMFDKVKVPTVAVVQNMSFFVGDDGKTYYPFGQGALKKLEREYGFKHTVEMPILAAVSEAGDTGVPLVIRHPSSDAAVKFSELASFVVSEVARLSDAQTDVPAISTVPGKGVVLEYVGREPVVLVPWELRVACQCAHCVNEMTGVRVLDSAGVPKDVEVLTLRAIGNYAVGINWSDGHSSIYPYGFLGGMVAI